MIFGFGTISFFLVKKAGRSMLKEQGFLKEMISQLIARSFILFIIFKSKLDKTVILVENSTHNRITIGYLKMKVINSYFGVT